jgi:hypothetical protein
MSQLALIPTDGSFVPGTSAAQEPERVLLDSLPYVDAFDEDDRRRAEELIRLELLKFAPPNYLEGRPDHKIEFSVRSLCRRVCIFFFSLQHHFVAAPLKFQTTFGYQSITISHFHPDQRHPNNFSKTQSRQNSQKFTNCNVVGGNAKDMGRDGKIG